MLDLEGTPPTQLLYYEDAYIREFEAKNVKILKTEACETGLVLDKTAFYPGGGGQLPDVGSIESSVCKPKLLGCKDEVKRLFISLTKLSKR